jgi:hypothetical protein
VTTAILSAPPKPTVEIAVDKSKPIIPRDELICYNCNKKGHTSRFCTEPLIARIKAKSAEIAQRKEDDNIFVESENENA